MASLPPRSSQVLTPEYKTLFRCMLMSQLTSGHRVLGNEIVTLYVGPKRKEFTVHKKLICSQSEFFNAAFNEGFKEAVDGQMYLPEDRPNTFAALIDYFYRGALPCLGKKPDGLLLYFLAEKLCMSELMDKIMDSMRFYPVILNFPAAALNMVYRSTHISSKLRLYAVAGLVTSVGRKQMDQTGVELYMEELKDHPEFFLDFFRFQSLHATTILPRFAQSMQNEKIEEFVPRCEFHSHGEKQVCYLIQEEAALAGTAAAV